MAALSPPECRRRYLSSTCNASLLTSRQKEDIEHLGDLEAEPENVSLP